MKPFRRFRVGEKVPAWIFEPSVPCESRFIKEADIYHVGKKGYKIYPVEEIKKGETLVECILLTEQEGDIDGKGMYWSGVPYGMTGLGEGFVITVKKHGSLYQNIRLAVEP